MILILILYRYYIEIDFSLSFNINFDTAASKEDIYCQKCGMLSTLKDPRSVKDFLLRQTVRDSLFVFPYIDFHRETFV